MPTPKAVAIEAIVFQSIRSQSSPNLLVIIQADEKWLIVNRI